MRNPPTYEEINFEASQLHTNRHHSFIRFFVSLWARIKSLFSTSFREACNCSCNLRHTQISKNLSSNDVSVNFEEGEIVSNYLGENFQLPLVSSSLSSDLNKSTILNVSMEASNEFPFTAAEICCLEENIFCDTMPMHEFEWQQPNRLFFFSDVHQRCGTSEVLVLNDAQPSSFSSRIELQSFSNNEKQQSVSEIIRTPESINDFISLPPSTITSRLYNQLKNGEISHEEHKNLFESVVISVIPRNLSDTIETRHPIEATQMCYWPSIAIAECDKEESNMLMNTLSVLDSAYVQSDSSINVISETTYVRDFIEDIVNKSLHYIHNAEISEKQNTSDMSIIEESVKEYITDMKKADISEHNSTNSHFANTLPDYFMLPERNSKLMDYTLSLSTDFNNFSLDASIQQSIDSVKILRSKRSSSLKSETSPINTPSRKIVRFADALGLDLTTVRQLQDQENPPKIPASATFDLHLDSEKSLSSLGAKQFQLCFPQPGASSNFLHRVLQDGVSLESARVDSSRGLLTGAIRVKSFGFEKNVSVRISYNNWNTFCEVTASYVQDSHDGSTDKFSFCAIFPSTVVAGENIQFAIRYETHTKEIFWDSNHGANYVVSCYAKATDMAGDGSWLHFL